MAGLNIRPQILKRVVRKLGGPEATARLLRVTPRLLQRYLKGLDLVPDSLLLKALDRALDSEPPDPLAVAQPKSPPPKAPPAAAR